MGFLRMPVQFSSLDKAAVLAHSGNVTNSHLNCLCNERVFLLL